MTILIIGIALFLGVHVFSASFRDLRARIVERFGLGAYKGGHAVIAATGLALIIYGFIAYRAQGLIQIWSPPEGMRYVALPLVWFAFVALASRRAPPSRIRSVLRHPTLVGVKSWSLAHLLANGDLGGLILFGSFLAFAVYDRIVVKRRAT